MKPIRLFLFWRRPIVIDGPWLLLMGLIFWPLSARAIDGTFMVTESWSLTLDYSGFGTSDFTGTRRYNGTQSGTIRITNGTYQILDQTGVAWSAPSQNLSLKTRTISFNGLGYNLQGGYVFAPAFGAHTYGLVFLGCFAVSIPLIEGEVPTFYDYERYSGSGPLSAIHGGGNMIGGSLQAYVSSTVSFKEVVGPPAIVQQPRSQTVYEGQNVTFSVVAAGRTPLSYNWRKGAAVLAGANGTTLTLTNVQLADAASYSVMVSNAGGKVTSAPALLTVKPPAAPWFEGWESANLGTHYLNTNDQSTLIVADKKYWVVSDTVSFFPDCGPPLNHADIVLENGRKLLKLTSVASGSGCADNISVSIDSRTSTSLPIPLLPDVQVSFFEQGMMTNPYWNGFFGCVAPPCGDTVNLALVDDKGNQVVYIFQRAPNYVEHTGIGYTEIFLDTGGGSFSRNLFDDFAGIAGAGNVGTVIERIDFGISSEGWAVLDDLQIGSVSTNSDRSKPVLAITSPAPGTRLTNGTVVVQGTASDNTGVALVEYRLENAEGTNSYQPTSGTSHWSAMVSGLIPGTNTVRFRAKDVVGNFSSEAARTFIYVAGSPLTLIVQPGGRVTGATNRQVLELGTIHMLTAIASNGFTFSNWSGDISSFTNTLKFAMRSNLFVQANFVPNPFLQTTGTYDGLFCDSSAVRHESAGFFAATLRPSGDFSAYLQIGTNRFPFTGRFDLEGKATNRVSRPRDRTLMVELNLSLDGGDEITGRVTDGLWAASLAADRHVFNPRTRPATMFTNKYTLSIPGSTNGAVEPAGDGIGSVVVTPDGIVTVSGVLADGSAVAQRVPLSRAGDWPFYLSLYGGKGSLMGWLHFHPLADVDLEGRLNWFRPVLAVPKVYTNGFARQSMAIGSVYRPIGTNRVFDLDTARVEFAGGNLASFTETVMLGENARVTKSVPDKLTLTIAPSSGLFSGTVTPTGSIKSLGFKGVLLQRQGYGSGFFLGTNESGLIYFGP